MISQAKGTGVVGYNVQAAVDTKQHLIVTHEVTNVGNDRAQLTKMATAARDEMGKTKMQAVADRGYFSSNEIKATRGRRHYAAGAEADDLRCQGRGSLQQGSTSSTSPKDDEYQCPAGERAIHRFSREEDGLTIHMYWTSACPRLPDARHSARPATTGASGAGSTNTSWKRCSGGSTASPRR